MSLRQNLVTAVATVAIASTGLFPATALASPKDKLEAARSEIIAYGNKLAETQTELVIQSDALNVTQSLIVQRQAEADQTQQKLDRKRAILAEHIRENYRAGKTRLVSVLLEAESVQDLVNRVYYLDKIAERNANEITEVRNLEDSLHQQLDQLEEQRSEQQEQLEETQAQAEEYQQQVLDAQAYYQQLSAEVQAQLAAEAAAARAAQAAASKPATNSYGVVTDGMTNAMNAVQTEITPIKDLPDPTVSNGYMTDDASGTTADDATAKDVAAAPAAADSATQTGADGGDTVDGTTGKAADAVLGDATGTEPTAGTTDVTGTKDDAAGEPAATKDDEADPSGKDAQTSPSVSQPEAKEPKETVEDKADEKSEDKAEDKAVEDSEEKADRPTEPVTTVTAPDSEATTDTTTTSGAGVADDDSSNASTTQTATTTGGSVDTSRQNIIDAAYSYIGVPYVWGGKSPEGFDCSGLTTYVYEESGIDVGGNRTTYALIDWMQENGTWKTSLDELQPGDMLFPSDGHVAIYLGDGMMIHAPHPGASVEVAPVYAFIGGGWAGA